VSAFHQPVMVSECLQMLAPAAGKTYVDATLGGGGHSLALLKHQPEIRLFAFDQDAQAIQEASRLIKKDNVTLIKSNFKHLRTQLAYHKVKQIDGILFDLGVSSHQLDIAERGFSFDKPASLDMRMDQSSSYTAKDAVNNLSPRELAKIFKEYGEELAANRIARAIEKARAEKEINTTAELARIIESVAGTGSKESLKSKVRIFQALRIHVNDELDCLQSALTDAINILAPGGRIVVLSYHSLEDRIVKNTFKEAARDCLCPPAIIKCICNHQRQIKIITSRPLTATASEMAENVRSRSAKLRAAAKE